MRSSGYTLRPGSAYVKNDERLGYVTPSSSAAPGSRQINPKKYYVKNEPDLYGERIYEKVGKTAEYEDKFMKDIIYNE